MKTKIISSSQHKGMGVCFVTIQNKYGKFNGFSACSSEDMENFSAFAGERYALMRAYKAFAKYRLKQEKIKLKTIKDLIKDIEYNSNIVITKDDLTFRRIKLKLRDYTQSVSDWENIYNFYEQEIKNQDEKRQALLKRAKGKKD